MATIQPRVQVCLNAETKAVYDNAAKVMGISTSRLIANICGDAAPSIIQVTKMLESAKTGTSPLELLKFAKGFASDSMDEIAGHQIDLEDAIAATKRKTKAKGKPKA